MSTRKQGVPVLLAESTGGVGLRAWCPICVKYHQHGTGGGEIPLYDHRWAHCIEGPFLATGYYLKRPDKWK